MKINKIFSTLFGGALLLGAAACTDEVEYTPASPVTVEGVYLSDSESNVVDIPTDGNKVSINLYRVNADKAIAVGLSGEVLAADGTPVPDIFSVPTEVTFPEGATVVPIEIGVVFGDVTPEEEYTLNLKVLGDQVNPYGTTEREYVIIYAPWSEWEMVTNDGNSECTVTLGSWLNGTATLPVWERHSLVNSNRSQLMLADPLTLDFTNPEFDLLTDADWYYILTVDKANEITVDQQKCYVVTTNIVDTKQSNSNGKYFFTCSYTMWTEVLGYDHDRALAKMAENNMKQSYYNPAKGLYSINTVVYIPTEGGLSLIENGYDYILLPGYKDYWMEFEYLGNYVDTMTQESAIVQATRCPDLASFAYVCEPGALTDTQIAAAAEAIKADTEADLNFDENSNLLLTLKEDGTYTIVAVGYDEGGNAVYETSYTFDYKSVQKESEWESRGWCLYTDGFFVNPWYSPQMGGQTWDVEIEEHKQRAGYYRLVNPYKEWPMTLALIEEGVNVYSKGMYYLYINAEDPTGVYIEDSDSGINLGLATGDVTGHSIIGSLAYYFMEQGHSFQEVKENGWCGVLANDVITFGAGTLSYAEAEYKDGTKVNANLDPNNPVYTDSKNPGFQFNPYLGTGTFQIDMSTIERAPRRSNAANVTTAGLARRIAGAADYAIKGSTSRSNNIKSMKMTPEQIKANRENTIFIPRNK